MAFLRKITLFLVLLAYAFSPCFGETVPQEVIHPINENLVELIFYLIIMVFLICVGGCQIFEGLPGHIAERQRIHMQYNHPIAYALFHR